MEQKRKKFYTLCKDTNLNFTLANYQKFYLRQPLLGLLQYHKPVIVTGTIDINPFDHFYTVKDVKPYYPKYEDTLVTLCYHINLFKDQVNEFIDFTKIPYLNKLFVLICEPYNYIDKDNPYFKIEDRKIVSKKDGKIIYNLDLFSTYNEN